MSKVDPKKPLDEQTRIFEIAGRRFEIPLMYIDGWPEPGEQQESILLEVIWPEMTSIWELENRAEYDRVTKKERRIGWILLSDPSRKKSVSDQVSGLRRRLIKEESLGVHDGLERHYWYHKRPDGPKLWYDAHLERDAEGNIISFIDCSPIEKSKTPTCRHYFDSNGIKFKISYNRKTFFSDWRDQRERAINLVNSFEIKSKETLESEK